MLRQHTRMTAGNTCSDLPTAKVRPFHLLSILDVL
jgi:hypothetical protein